MRILRTLSTARLITVAAAACIVLVGGAALAVTARGGGGEVPAAKPLAQAAHDSLAAAKPSGITARITFTNKLFPSGALVGATGSALMSGATGRLWLNAKGGRLELQSDAGDVQLTWNDAKATLFDASSNTAYTFDLPKQQADPARTANDTGVPSVDEITKLVTELGKDWTVSTADPTNTAGQPSYSVKVSPAHDGGLLGSAQLVWAAANGVPLKVAIYARDSSSPVLALAANDISFGPVSDSDVQVSPPAGAKMVDLSSQANSAGDTSAGKAVTGLGAVQAAAGFTVTAPDTLVGLPRQDVRLVGPSDGHAALVVYGQGLGAIVLVERKVDAKAGATAGPLASLPTISLDGVTAHELATQLGTVLSWDRNGVSYVLAGSLPSSAAETAASSIK